MKKIVSVVGARPQFMKAAVVSEELRKSGFHEILVHTGQHYDFNMSDVFFQELNLPQPDYYLGIGSGLHGEQTGKMLIEIEKVLIKESPDMVIVYGDTNTTLAGALAAAKLHIPIAHVEAGLRSYNRMMPEEINRVITDHLSDLLFAPTEIAVKNLKKEGLIKGVHLVGDVMYDLAKRVSNLTDDHEVLDKYGLESKQYILVTIHRAENTDDKNNLHKIIEGLNLLADEGVDVLFPIHPRTEKALRDGGVKLSEKVKVIPAVSYKEMIVLEKNARVIITDSGGVQKEGYFFKVPCVIPRNETEWVELIESGWNVLVGQSAAKLFRTVLNFWQMNRQEIVKVWDSHYGIGNSAVKIRQIIHRFF